MSDVPLVYADASALGALLVAQPDTEALAAWLDEANVRLVSSDLLETELRRMAVREGRDQAKVSAILDGVGLAVLDRATYRSAGFLPIAMRVRSTPCTWRRRYAWTPRPFSHTTHVLATRHGRRG
ncbi:hypothetical protein SAMN05443377_10732 [Propionibacterium cyclohexanicum]|uniref:PIN domain-containing protein n=1 Tax=Propionibacterium cyclohexanicum TaxID=64702 RepID=A0A1H9RFW0_9ACTN|nr:hypothetical protein [Propionibacterium cyclohexanicum]SER71517.1 hypothetical protein SAMN05443377_10732 [Propionibacterium cyclohexanicum]